MSDLNKILLIALILTLICFFTLKLFYTVLYSKIKILEINSPDANISTSKIDEIINNLKIYLKASDFNIDYGSKDNYQRIYQMLNKKKKTIEIPKWIMPSIGYELDYIIASIWYNIKVYQKDNFLKKFNFFASVIPFIFLIIFYLFTILSFILYIVYYFVLNNPVDIVSNKFYEFLLTYPILQIIAITSFLLLVIDMFYINRIKLILETKYESEIIAFVDEYCQSYRYDITAARVYATNFNRINFKIFRFNSKTLNMKFLGPFTFL
ncbi:transmembrane protein [Spiroplasma litorale]|uniref:Transmembrane protein n=1 Tax=Spiroplasma litorale TaxID=216942 RepID=A0A0K1W2A0_9MOLU|nr:hypothetical protein [Spiroplasma litorale]AKX34455.1 transmembrane protein [Spiroplasma litorale]